ncbi:MAG: L,D-transpeptidase family protein [Planctomycetota bacterium]
MGTMVKKRLLVPVAALGVAVVGAAILSRRGRWLWVPAYRALAGSRTVKDVLQRYGPAAEGRLRPHFQRAGVAYPPKGVALVGFKAEKRLELWAAKGKGWAFIRSYRIRAASGKAGPKLREGDRQVPEGLYTLEYLNPNSRYHLSMKISYPNAFDRKHAKAEGRSEPGSDIFLHGQAVSIGCLAMGDRAIEELFCLVARVGASRVKVLLAPNDLRAARPVTDLRAAPRWVPDLYKQLKAELRAFPLPQRKDTRP